MKGKFLSFILLACFIFCICTCRAHLTAWFTFHHTNKRVPDKHKLFGALSQLNTKLGDKAVHWFMKGWDGSDVLSTNPKIAPRDNDHIVWRSKHIPNELVELLKKESINKVYVVGGKASVSVQIACQVLMDYGIEVCVIRECVQDDNDERLQATLDHILPVFGSVITLEQLMEVWGGLGSLSKESQQSYTRLISPDDMLLACDCVGKGMVAGSFNCLLNVVVGVCILPRYGMKTL